MDENLVKVDDFSVPAMRNTLMVRMGMEVVSACAQRVEITMPLQGNTQPFGILHGGASAALAETAASVAANLWAAPRIAVGAELSIRHLKPGRTDVRAVATALEFVDPWALYQIEVFDQDSTLVAIASLKLRAVDSV